MGNEKENNEDESAHPSGTDTTIDAQQEPLQEIDAQQDPVVPMDQGNPPIPSHTEAVLGGTRATDLQQSQTEAASDSNSAELKTTTQPPQTEIVRNVNNEGLTADDQQLLQIESSLVDNNVEFNTGPRQPESKAVGSDDDDNVELKTSRQTETAPNDNDMSLKSSPQKPHAEVAPSDNNVELKSDPQQPLQGSCLPAAPDDSKSLDKPETESPTEEKTKAGENSDCKRETCGVDGTSNSISNIETAKPTADSISEPSEVPQNDSGHHAGAVPKEHSERASPHAESSDIKTELENKRELKDGSNEIDTAAPKSNGHSSSKNLFLLENYDDGSESGSEEEQWAFMKELENFFRERSMEFKPPKFYGEGLNCLKLWRQVMRLGGYDKVTSCKLWRQVGESFKPPKTCTTVSWTFRGFYEKALLDYERHKISGGELNLPLTSNSEPMIVDSQTPGSGRARRDAAARAMQGWHSQRLLGNGEVSDAIIKDKNSVPVQKREKQLKNVGLLKRKKPSYMEHAVKAARAKTSKPQVEVVVVDLGQPADWVKINVQRTNDCFEVYALVPGLLREEVRVQSDPAGRLVISGEPEHPDNPWGVTPFKKVVTLPSRIDPHKTSAVVTLHGQLFVRVPFQPSD